MTLVKAGLLDDSDYLYEVWKSILNGIRKERPRDAQRNYGGGGGGGAGGYRNQNNRR